MKKLLLAGLMLLISYGLFAQISVENVSYDSQTDQYYARFIDGENSTLGAFENTEFVWYLSYKGKRVSDYCYSSSNGHWRFSKKHRAWPDEVPIGKEKYVTVQLGKEPARQDYRDDE